MPPVSLDMRQLSYYMNQNCDRVPGDLPYFRRDRKYMVTAAPGAGTGNNLRLCNLSNCASPKWGSRRLSAFFA